ncbi:hypothetical protein [Kitasatospora sp. NPDC088134]|uniref:hypothetical protein n=1 Tax=Kitasatospora sp. NPDC088134 TaxID=3364071 RepID=UPI00382BD419
MEKPDLYAVTPPVEERFKSPLSEGDGACATFAAIRNDAGDLIGVYQGDSQNPDLLGVRYTVAEFLAMAGGIDAIRTKLGL